MTKFKCNQCGKSSVFQVGMTSCPYCQNEYSTKQLDVMTESADIHVSIDTAKASATISAPIPDEEDDEISIGSSRTALAADLGYVDNPRHMKSLTSSVASGSAYGSTAGKSSAIPPRTVGDEESGSEIRDYKLETEIGQGSFGTVYRAIQVPLDRSVAIKLLKPLPIAPSTEGDQSKASRVQQETRIRDEFLREAQFTGKLEHPNIVPIHDIGIVSGGKRTDRPFYVMKEIKGISWQDVLSEKTRDENLDIFGRVVDAIGFSHSRDILHCDLKPENVMLGEFGEVLVVDWGQAISTNQKETYRPGGTPAYCSPEMAQYWCDFGENPDRVPESAQLIGPRSDVYLLGAILFQMVTGRAPHFGLKGETPADVMRRASKNEIRRHDKFVNDELMQIALRTLRKMDEHIVTVSQLQVELKSYEERKRSIDIRDRAFELLKEAKVSSDYDTYQKAKFGFEESLELWKENPTAWSGLHMTRLSCAELALKDQNFDLGLGMLAEADTDEELKVKEKLVVGRRKRDRRKQLVYLLGIAFAGAVVIGGLVSSSLFNRAIKARGEATDAIAELDVKTQEAETAKTDAALAVKQTAEAEKKLEDLKPLIAAADIKVREADIKVREAEGKKIQAEMDIASAQMEVAKANNAKAAAVIDTQKAVDALEAAKESSQLLVYKTRMSSVVETLNRGDFYGARKILNGEDAAVKESFEWRRLSLLAHPEVTNDSLFPEESLMGAELSGDRNQVALCFDDRIEIRQTTKLDKLIGKPIKMADLGLDGVERIALSHDGSKLAVAFQGSIYLVDSATGKRSSSQPLRAQSRGITDLGFNSDGTLLLSVGEPSQINSSVPKGERRLMVYEFDGGTWDQLSNVEFSGALARPETAVFSKNSNRIVTSSPNARQGKQYAFVLERKDDTFEWVKPIGGVQRLRSGNVRGEFFNSVFADDQGKQVISSFISRSGSDTTTNQIVVWNADDSSGTMQISTRQERDEEIPTVKFPVFEAAHSVAVRQPIRHLDYSGNTLLATSEKQMLYWQLPDGDLSGLERPPKFYDGHGKPIAVAGVLNAGSKFMTISAKENPEILLTNTTTYQKEQLEINLTERSLSDESSPSAFSESVQKDYSIVGNDHGLVSVSQLDGNARPLKWQVSAWNKHLVTKKHLFALSDRDDLYRYNLVTGELETILTKLSLIKTDQTGDLRNKIVTIDVSDNSQFAVVQRQNDKPEFEIWNLETQTVTVVSYRDKTGLEESTSLAILTISDDGKWIAGSRVRFYVWQNDGTYVGDAGVENNVKELISGLKFVSGTSKVAVGRKNVLKVYDVSGGSTGLDRFAEYRIKDFPASPRRPNVVDAQEIDGKAYLMIRKVFKNANQGNESGLDLIRLDDNKNVTVLHSVPGAQQANITRGGKMLAISLEERSLLGFDLKTGVEIAPRNITIPARESAGDLSEKRDVFSGVYETENDDLVLHWTSNNRQNSVSVGTAGELSNLSVIATPTLRSVKLNGNRAVTFENGSVRIWDLDFENRIVKPAGTIRGNFSVLKVSPDARLAFAISKSENRKGLIDLGTGDWATDFPIAEGMQVGAAAWSADANRIAIGFDDGSLRIWEGNELTSIDVPLAGLSFDHVGFSDDGESVVVVQSDDKVLGSGVAHVVRKVKDPNPNQAAWLSIRLKHLDQDSITSADLSIDGSRVVTGSSRGRVTLWNSESEVGTTNLNDSSERELMNLHQFFSGVRMVQFGANDSSVVTFESDSAKHNALKIPTD